MLLVLQSIADTHYSQGSVKVVRCIILNRSEGSVLGLKEDSSLRLRVTKSMAIGLFGDIDGTLHYSAAT